ncbi:LPXTG cell wall anchor domain-containing protein [Catellatospora citrea]|uniref:LPXTG cell wall anchor domain-containing protein n=1 Tax=Catellatospora citrea TaxID=53366 RepID=UPI0033C43F3F
MRNVVRWFSAAAALLVAVLAAPAPAADAAAPTQVLALEEQYLQKKLTAQPPALRDCEAVPQGASAGTDGWVFEQPAAGNTAAAYVIGFIAGTRENPTPHILGITADGVVEVPLSDPTSPGPAPAGVSGGLLGNGGTGAWLKTPAGWELISGQLQVAEPTEQATFGLAAVCAPPAAPASPRPSASVVPSRSPVASASPRATAAITPSASAGGLPVTGSKLSSVVLAGLGLLLVGALLLVLSRRARRA